MKRVLFSVFCAVTLLVTVGASNGCDTGTPQSTSGVTKAKVKVVTGSDGLTQEQRNVTERIKMENQPGSIKHLYVISAMTGDVIFYSTVKGKITSSGKRLSPYSVSSGGDIPDSIPIQVGNQKYYTPEVLQDDGTYGSSIPYVFWWDVQDRYHQHYPAGGQIVHVSNYPISWPKIIMNMELQEIPSSE